MSDTCHISGCKHDVPAALAELKVCILHFTLSLEASCAEMRRETALGNAPQERQRDIMKFITTNGESLARVATSGLHLTDDLKARVLSTFLTLMNLRENLDRVGVADRASVHQEDVLRYLGRPAGDRFGLVFLDPPYLEHAILAPLERLVARLAPGATVVVKHHWRTPIPEPPGLARWRERRFGETALTFLAATDGADGVEEP